jgi:CRP/FNR family transcriptional regulator, anaerobic regulatory protein
MVGTRKPAAAVSPAPTAAPRTVDCARCDFEPCTHCASRQYSVCAPVPVDELPRFFSMAARLSIAPRRTLFDEGDRADYVFSITRGAVSLSKALSDGRRQITGFLFDGDFVGLAHADTCAYTAEALTPLDVCRFPRARFEAYVAEQPNVERRLLQIASTELAAAQDQMLLLGRKTAVERFASFLIRLSDRAVLRARPGNPIALPMTRSEIADYLGLTIETVSRTITQLRRMGAIDLDGLHQVRMTSEETLRRLVDRT